MLNLLSSLLAPLKQLKTHFKVYLLTSLILQVLLAYLAKGLLSFIFNRILLFAGITGLSLNNWSQIIQSPLALGFFILYLILVTGTITLEFTILTLVVAKTSRSLAIKPILKALPQKLKQLVGPQLLVLLVYILLMVPLANFGLNSTLLERFKIPDFIADELLKTGSGRFIYYGTMVSIAYLNLRLIYLLPLYTLSPKSPWQAWKKSWQITKGRALVSLVFSLACYSLLALGFLGIIYGLNIGIFSVLDPTGTSLPLQTLFFSLSRSANFIANVAFKYLIIGLLIQASNQTLAWPTPKETQAPLVNLKFPKWGYLIIALVLGGWTISNGITLYLTPENHQVQLVAHRGDVSRAVENSIPAMQAAHQAGADYSEMDIIMTKDHEFVVSHDNNLKRLTGRNQNISDLTLKQVTRLKTYQDGHSGRIASLEEFMAAAKKSQQPIMLELKPYDEDKTVYAKALVNKLKTLKLSPKDKIMSLDLQLIERIEKALPQVETGYLIPLQLVGLPKHQVDFYAIEEFSYTNYMVLQAYQQKKDLYVWTINDQDLMRSFLHTPVKGIISDRLALFNRQKKELAHSNSYFERALNILNSDWLN